MTHHTFAGLFILAVATAAPSAPVPQPAPSLSPISRALSGYYPYPPSGLPPGYYGRWALPNSSGLPSLYSLYQGREYPNPIYPSASRGWVDARPGYFTYRDVRSKNRLSYYPEDTYLWNGLYTGRNATTATVTIRVPRYGAEVWVDGVKMREVGFTRKFITPGMPPEATYGAEVRARWTAAGRQIEQTRKVTVPAGGNVNVEFTTPDAEEKPEK